MYCIENADYLLKVNEVFDKMLTLATVSKESFLYLLLCLECLKIRVPKFLRIKIFQDTKFSLFVTAQNTMRFKEGKLERSFLKLPKGETQFSIIQYPPATIHCVHVNLTKDRNRFKVNFIPLSFKFSIFC